MMTRSDAAHSMWRASLLVNGDGNCPRYDHQLAARLRSCVEIE